MHPGVYIYFNMFPPPSAIKAAENLGFPYIQDVNSSDTHVLGMANMSYTMDERGYRNDTASAFLPPSLVKTRKNNLNISTGALVTKILFSSDNLSSRPRAVGVQVESADGPSNKREIMVNKEIILCAGAIGSPQLLLLSFSHKAKENGSSSGIGPKDHLSKMNIKVVKDLPGVGNHMQDHFGIPVIFEIPLNDSIIVLQKRPLTAIKEIFKFLISGQGLLTSPIHELSIFAQSHSLTADFANAKSGDKLDWTDSSNIPDLEIMTIAVGETDLSKMNKDTGDGGFGLWTGVVQPFSRGYVRLKSIDPRIAPSCDLNFLGDSRDREAAYAGISLSMRLKEEIAKLGYPITDVAVPKSLDPADLDAHITAQGLTLYHYSSSCRMAPEDDPLPGVVDDELKVHGIDGLRIADASIFPNVLATHLQAAVVAVAEKCADMVLNEASS
ncbi:hypothetical protein Clacol_009276 [Clathrus columnatus]|uniref:Glucose-methanol-choline oxidoreductase N-terminal domain-containing protein n=1 Tax=Clathrus columnatus TaxID=1419009 RepID=A0AAV5APB7_9AGAM|nr:hypothetical protein Clacol_009276 [Clathrus columnatus]